MSERKMSAALNRALVSCIGYIKQNVVNKIFLFKDTEVGELRIQDGDLGASQPLRIKIATGEGKKKLVYVPLTCVNLFVIKYHVYLPSLVTLNPYMCDLTR